MPDRIHFLFFGNDTKKDHLPALDGLRGVAILFVLLSHSSFHHMLFFPGLDFVGIGKEGVYLFYVLSAFLLDSQIASALMNHKATYAFWLRYFIRRFLRIYPLFFLILLLYWTCSQWGIETPIRSWNDIVQHLLLLQGYNIFWSIPVEFKYYLLSPFVLLICHYGLHWKWKPVLIFLSVLWMSTMVIDYFYPFNKISVLKHIGFFLTGTGIAIFYIQQRNLVIKEQVLRIITWAALLAIFLGLFMTPHIVDDVWSMPVMNNGRKTKILFAFLCGLMLFAALYGKGLYSKIMTLPVLRFIGIISFSLYLLHMPVIYFIEHFLTGIPAFLQIYVFFGLVIAVSSTSYLLIERPLSRIRIPKRSPASPDPLL
jgi:peptidoglycan/LPS O-acetylase OafA/YrhL